MNLSAELCIFCLRQKSDARPWCPDSPGKGCMYGLDHEYPCAVCGNLLCKIHIPGAAVVAQQKKIDKQICIKCNLHLRNPASKTSECAHEYPQ